MDADDASCSCSRRVKNGDLVDGVVGKLGVVGRGDEGCVRDGSCWCDEEGNVVLIEVMVDDLTRRTRRDVDAHRTKEARQASRGSAVAPGAVLEGTEADGYAHEFIVARG
ncbi:hypothetical protein FGB62_68g127 [Gracilaria domingensis]|nr:hypothetical protein FGB62_68g127 [Gracilaria domingensis]